MFVARLSICDACKRHCTHRRSSLLDGVLELGDMGEFQASISMQVTATNAAFLHSNAGPGLRNELASANRPSEPTLRHACDEIVEALR